MLATQTDAHYEWHTNTGTRIWHDSCPWDSCGLYDEEEFLDLPPTASSIRAIERARVRRFRYNLPSPSLF